MTKAATIAVIGGGMTGTILAVQILRRRVRGVRVCLFDLAAAFGQGLAYSTRHDGHLLNVPAGRMSAFADEDTHFLDWLRGRVAVLPDGTVPAASSFVPRHLYGAYGAELLEDAARDGALDRRRDEVVGLAEDGSGARITLASGAQMRADIVVLANGNFLPPRYRLPGGPRTAQAWDPDALTAIRPADPVLLMGSGLTMVDVAIALLDQGHRGPIHVLSRRGLLPRAHAATPLPPPEVLPPPAGGLVAMFRELRRRMRAAETAGADWRGVIDSLRPHTQAIWQALGPVQQTRFLRHARPWWDVHRHRMAPRIAARIASAMASGQLLPQAGRVTEGAGSERVRILRRGGTADTLTIRHVIDCTGVAATLGAASDPLLQALFDAGLARPDAIGLGLDVTAEGAVINNDGQPSPWLLAAGPLTKGLLWEITAVPDIRIQAARMAERLCVRVGGVAVA